MPKKIQVIVHEPIFITQQTEEELKTQVFQLLSTTLKEHERKA
jgi:hypothetical protein